MPGSNKNKHNFDRSLTFRSIAVNAGNSINVEKRSYDTVMTTEQPVAVWDWDRGLIDEILLMDGCVNIGIKQLPLLDSHDRSSIEKVLGSVRDFRVENNEMIGTVTVSKTEDKFFTKIQEGHITDHSIGYRVLESEWIPEGEVRTIGGKTYEGPVKLSTKWEKKELSSCIIGADDLAKIRSEENLNEKQRIKSKENDQMNKEIRAMLEGKGLRKDATEKEALEFLRNLPVEQEKEVDVEALRIEAKKEGAESERAKSNEIDGLLRSSDFSDEFCSEVKKCATVEDARKSVLDEMIRMSKKNKVSSSHVDVGVADTEKFRSAVVDGFVLRSGISLEKPAPGALDFRSYSLMEISREILRRKGLSISGSESDIAERALATADLSAVCGAIANKSFFNGYDSAEETFPIWTGEESVKDFKLQTAVQLSEFDDVDEVKEDGEYKYGYFSDGKNTFKIYTYGKILLISRQALINDDLGILTSAQKAMGESIKRKQGDVAYAVLTANSNLGDGVALFNTATHKNLASSGAAIGTAPLATAIKSMKLQKDLKGKRTLNIRPQFVLAPVSLEGSAEVFFRSERFDTANAGATRINPYSGNYFTRVYEPRLDDDSEISYYLAGAKGKTVNMIYLNGNKMPRVASREGFVRDGIEIKISHDFGGRAVDYKSLYKNPGA